MTNETEQIVDIRFNIKHDNPFRDPHDLGLTQKRTNNFYKLISEHPENFRTINWIEDSRINQIERFTNTRIFNESMKEKLKDNKKLCYHVANCLKKTGDKLEKNLIPELKKFVDQYSTMNILSQPNINKLSNENIISKNIINEDSETLQNETDKNLKPSFTVSLDNIPPQSMADVKDINNISENIMDHNSDLIYKSIDDITTYDFTPGKQLTYEDLCKLTIAIARSQLSETVKKDENILFIEEREKDKIRKNLEKYMGNADIATMYPNLDINSLSLKQLQYYSGHIEDYYETLKLMNFMKKGLDMADLGYTKLFPDGIQMPGGKYKLKLDGAVESIKKVLFDRESPVKIAFKNVQEKYNLHISDEFLLCLNIGAAICSKIHFDKVEKKDSTKTKQTDNKNSEDETSTDEQDKTSELSESDKETENKLTKQSKYNSQYKHSISSSSSDEEINISKQNKQASPKINISSDTESED